MRDLSGRRCIVYWGFTKIYLVCNAPPVNRMYMYIADAVSATWRTIT